MQGIHYVLLKGIINVDTFSDSVSIRSFSIVEEIDYNDVQQILMEVLNSSVIKNIDVEDAETIKSEVYSHFSANRRLINNINAIKRHVANKKNCSYPFDCSDLILSTSRDKSVLSVFHNYYDPKPAFFCKYMGLSHAFDNVLNGCFRCGTPSSYRKIDPNEMKPILDVPYSSEEFRQLLIQEVIKRIMVQPESYIGDKLDWIDRAIDRLFFVGCVTDSDSNDYLWDNYAWNGICIVFRSDGIDARRVTYSDSPVEPEYIREKFFEFCSIVDSGSKGEVLDGYDALMDRNLNIGLLNLYRKDLKYYEESEWRVLIERKSRSNSYFMPVKILKVISSLPKIHNARMKMICERLGIVFDRVKRFYSLSCISSYSIRYRLMRYCI